MAVNKVVFGAVAIMDISDSTVTEDTLAEGTTAYRADGEKITGTMKAAEDLEAVITELETKVETLNTALEEKASGGLKTCTLTLSRTAFEYDIWYFDGNSMQSETVTAGVNYTVACGVPIVFNSLAGGDYDFEYLTIAEVAGDSMAPDVGERYYFDYTDYGAVYVIPEEYAGKTLYLEM